MITYNKGVVKSMNFNYDILSLIEKNKKRDNYKETIYFAGGCLWGSKTIDIDSKYDGYSECVKTTFNP